MGRRETNTNTVLQRRVFRRIFRKTQTLMLVYAKLVDRCEQAVCNVYHLDMEIDNGVKSLFQCFVYVSIVMTGFMLKI